MAIEKKKMYASFIEKKARRQGEFEAKREQAREKIQQDYRQLLKRLIAKNCETITPKSLHVLQAITGEDSDFKGDEYDKEDLCQHLGLKYGVHYPKGVKTEAPDPDSEPVLKHLVDSISSTLPEDPYGILQHDELKKPEVFSVVDAETIQNFKYPVNWGSETYTQEDVNMWPRLRVLKQVMDDYTRSTYGRLGLGRINVILIVDRQKIALKEDDQIVSEWSLSVSKRDPARDVVNWINTFVRNKVSGIPINYDFYEEDIESAIPSDTPLRPDQLILLVNKPTKILAIEFRE